jgi:hypothetical protein
MTSACGAPVAGSAAEQGYVLYTAVNALEAQQPVRNALGHCAERFIGLLNEEDSQLAIRTAGRGRKW